MSAVLRVAAAQGECVAGNVVANVATASSLVREASGGGARVAVLPELFLTGYAPEVWTVEHALTPEDTRLDPLREVARENEVTVVVGAAVRRGAHPETRVTLSLLALDPAGRVTSVYDKQHLFADERERFTPGDRGASLLVDGWELGLGICYDGCFPEHAVAAAADGARAYLCPAAYYAGSEHRRDLYYAARALDNGIYVVMAGMTGRCGRREFSGGSAVYDPEGRVLVRAGEESPAVVLADLEAAEVSRVQQMNPIARDRARASSGRATGRRVRHPMGAA